MEQNQNLTAPESATDEPGSSSHFFAPEPPRFATAAEEAAYRAGLADGSHGAGPTAFDFDPVALRHRHDGLTPAKQREYVEALADTGIARVAAERIGVSERSVSRLRRRADAGAFNLACEAARRFGARRLHSIAWERAIEGMIRRHYYHGELKSEERVYDNRLLIYLLGKTEHVLEESYETRAVAGQWQPWVEAIEAGAPPPDLWPEPAPEPEPTAEEAAEDLAAELTGEEVWMEEGIWWTSFPPPAGFEGYEQEVFGQEGYQRTLSPDEQEAVAAGSEEEQEEALAHGMALRDLHFGFAGGHAGYGDDEDGEDEDGEDEDGEDEGGGGGGEVEIFSAREAGLSGPSAPPDVIAEPAPDADKEPR
jgi:hypothetical protein